MRGNSILSLFWKFAIAISATVLLFGLINLYFVNYAIYDLFEKELIKYGNFTGKDVAERSIELILYDDISELNKTLVDHKAIDSTIAYLFIVDVNNNVLAHTFEHSVPLNILKVKGVKPDGVNDGIKIIDKNRPDIIIRDMGFPILDGTLGYLRLGLYEESYFGTMRQTSSLVLAMIGIFLVFGVIGAFFFSYIIVTPIKNISDIARGLELGKLNLQEENIEKRIKNSALTKWKNILNIKDEIDLLINSFSDMVSRLRETYNELQKTQESLTQSEKMASLGTLVAGITHEINNPIAGIQNCIRRISESPENIKQNIAYIELMSEAVDKIELVVKGLLNFSRKQAIQFEEIDLKAIIENILILSAFQLEKSRITIKKKNLDNPIIVNGSTNHLEQVVLNLLLNSIDAIEERKANNPNHKGVIEFSVEENRKHIFLKIADNGIGLNPKNLKVIFDPFYSQKKIKQGTGLGLAVSYRIIEQHKGSIVGQNNSNGGLTIIITLPVYNKSNHE
jgi:two-component system, NtrC family, sensor kinase